MASGQIPTPDSPPSASPLSLSRMRRYFGGVARVINWRGCSNRPAPSQIKAKAEGSNGASHFEPPLSETPTPSSREVPESKHQKPSSKEIPSSKLQTAA